MYRFTAYGLTFASGIELPGVPSAIGDGSVDVTIRDGSIDTSWAGESPDAVEVRAAAGEITYSTPHGGIAVREGRKILVDRDGDGSVGGLLPQLLGPAVGMVLHQRGACVLHASCVVFDGHAVGFLGTVGSGKSTLAAACIAKGGAFIADDMLAVDPSLEGGRPMVHQGLPLLKLDEATADRLSRSFETVWASGDEVREPGKEGKRFYPVEAAGPGPWRLSGLYVVAPGEETAVESLEPRERLLALLGHAYAWRRLEQTEATEAYFRGCSALVDAVPIKRLSRPRSIEGLEAVIELVRDDVRTMTTHAG